MLKVPNALIRRLCYPTSYRLPKMEHMQYPPKPADTVKKPYVPSHVPTRLTQPTVQPSSTLDYEKGNLKNDEYRFFVGYPSTASTHSTCRWCQGRFETETARKAHKKAECKRKLTDLYAVLLKDSNCVMCDNRTPREYWGIPLCSATCRNEFKFTMSQAMKFEINRVLVTSGERMLT